MNRPIKFRAWDTSGNFMFQNNEIGSLVFYENGAVHVESKGEEFPCVVLMQSTGIKDKTGVNIYEGDIVLLPKEDSCNCGECFQRKDGRWLSVVQWHNVCLFINKHGRSSIVEILGNIYQNADLIK